MPEPAKGHMPFPGHRNMAQVDAQELLERETRAALNRRQGWGWVRYGNEWRREPR